MYVAEHEHWLDAVFAQQAQMGLNEGRASLQVHLTVGCLHCGMGQRSTFDIAGSE
ncbi:hypothetical protein D3C85_1880250 [compost metagenome]